MKEEKKINTRKSLAEYEDYNDFDDKDKVSFYEPSDEDKEEIKYIRDDFYKSWLLQNRGRREFDDLSLIDIVSRDQQSFNNYIPNGGVSGDWRNVSNKPTLRNNGIAVAANVASRIMFPSFYGIGDNGDIEKNVSLIYDDLVEHSALQKGYGNKYIQSIYDMLQSPAGVMYIGYQNIYRNKKTNKTKYKNEKEEIKEKWNVKKILDEENSGFQFVPVQIDQFFISNVYEPDIQKQDYLIWRKVSTYKNAKSRYGNYENFKYVLPGVKTIWNTANQSFYNIYDYEIVQYEVEEILYWNKNLDVFHILVNGIKLTEYGNPNPREDGLYPFAKSGYEFINPRFFYYKSLAHKGFSEAEQLNNLRSNILDGTFLGLFPPTILVGSDAITDEIISPGSVSVFQDPESKITQLNVASNLQAGVEALKLIEESLEKSSPVPIQNAPTGTQTAFEIARLETNTATVLGLFIRMLSDFTLQVGKLMMGDIDQYFTLLDISKISNNNLVYKTFSIPNSKNNKTKQIRFIDNIGIGLDKDTQLEESLKILEEEEQKNITIIKANPKLIKDMKKVLVIKPNTTNSVSEETKRQLGIELFNLSSKLPFANLPELYKDIILRENEYTKHTPDKYIIENNQIGQSTPLSIPKTGQPSPTELKFKPSLDIQQQK